MKKEIENYKAISLDELRDFILNNESKKKLPEYWLIYSPEIVAIIYEWVEAGNYPYNRDIENLVQQKLFPEINHSEDNRIFAHVVYTSQGYRQCIEDEKKEKALHEALTEKGFIKSTTEILNEAAGTKKKFYVVMNGSDWLGNETTRINENKFILKNWGEQGLHWMTPRSTRKGYRVNIGQYIKEAI